MLNKKNVLPKEELLSFISKEKSRIKEALKENDLSVVERWALSASLTSREKKLVLSGYIEGINRVREIIYDCIHSIETGLDDSFLTTIRRNHEI